MSKSNLYYAVKTGRKIGIYNTWKECHEQVNKYQGAEFKKFESQEEAQNFIDGKCSDEAKQTNTCDKTSSVVTNSKKISKKIKLNYMYYYNYPGLLRPEFNVKRWNKYYYMFTDGSFRNNKNLSTTSGYGVFVYGNEMENVSSRNNRTNNYCELTAIYEALKIIKKFQKNNENDDDVNRKYIIASDSEYCIKSVTKYMHNWVHNDWKRNGKNDISNLSRIKSIYKLLNELNDAGVYIGFMHVRSHLKEPEDTNSFDYYLWYGNQCADALATGKILPKQKINFKLKTH